MGKPLAECYVGTFGDEPESHVRDHGQGYLTQKQAAAVLQVSVSYLRASSCPKVLLPGNGKRGKPLVRYRQLDLLAWANSRST